MDEQRKLLDELMGNERNLNEDQKLNRKRHFSDSDVCKFYICGLSPYNLFKNTKSDLGAYEKEFDDDAKAQFQALSQEEKDKTGYEHELMVFLDRLVNQCDQKVKRHTDRIRQEQQAELKAVQTALSEEEMLRLGTIDEEIVTAENDAAMLGEAGRVDESMSTMARAEALKREASSLESKATTISKEAVGRKHMIVCDVSGNFMNSTDNGERLRCHFEGKQYQGWKLIRDKLVELKKMDPPAPGQWRERAREKERQVRREADRDRDKRDDRRDRDYERRDRDKRDDRRDRDYDRRDRDRDRGGYDRDRDRDRGYDRDRGHRDYDRDRRYRR